MAQGEAYKQTLLSQIGRVRDLIESVDKEAAISSQYRLKDLEKLCGEYFPTITRQLNDLTVQQNAKRFQVDQATMKDLSLRIGQSVAEYTINSFYSHLSSNPGIDGRTRGKLLGLSDRRSSLRRQTCSTTPDTRQPDLI